MPPSPCISSTCRRASCTLFQANRALRAPQTFPVMIGVVSRLDRRPRLPLPGQPRAGSSASTCSVELMTARARPPPLVAVEPSLVLREDARPSSGLSCALSIWRRVDLRAPPDTPPWCLSAVPRLRCRPFLPTVSSRSGLGEPARRNGGSAPKSWSPPLPPWCW